MGFLSKLFGKKKSEEAAEITIAEESKKNFEVVNGVLVRYYGDSTDLRLPETIKEIGEKAFAGCEQLCSITLTGVEHIHSYAFLNCENLHTVTLSESLKTLDKKAFTETEIKRVEYWGTIEQWCAISFGYDCSNPLHAGGVLVVGNAELTQLLLPETVKEVGRYAFSGCGSLIGVVLHGDVTVRDHAFAECQHLRSVVIPDGANVEWACFESCTSLIDVEMGDGITRIETSTFYNCKGLKRFDVPAAMEEIEESAFEYCNGLVEIYNKSVLDIVAGSEEFGMIAKYAKNVFSDEEESRVERIDRCFYLYHEENGEDTLIGYGGVRTELELPEGVDAIGDGAFAGHLTLESVVIPDGVKSIGKAAFMECKSLTEIELPESVEVIGEQAFNACEALEYVTIRAGVKKICAWAFGNLQELTAIRFLGTKEEFLAIERERNWIANTFGCKIKCDDEEFSAMKVTINGAVEA